MNDTLSPHFLWEEGDDVMIAIVAQPKSRKNELQKIHNHTLYIRIQSAPEQGKANEAICQFFSKIFKKSLSEIRIQRGHKSRQKILCVKNASLPVICTIIMQILQGALP